MLPSSVIQVVVYRLVQALRGPISTGASIRLCIRMLSGI